MPINDGTVARGFSYQWNPTKLNTDSQAFQRAIVENFRQLSIFLNSYVITKTSDGLTVPIVDLVVTGSAELATMPLTSDAPEHSLIYRDTAVQALTGLSWEKLEFSAALTVGNSVFTQDLVTNRSISVSQAGIYLVRAQAVFDADETGSIRVLEDGTERLRSGGSATEVLDVSGVVHVTGATGAEFTAEVFMDTAANAAVGSNNTFLSVTRLQSV